MTMVSPYIKKGIKHSYINARKIPEFIHYIPDHRDEFSGETYHFVDPDPVKMSRLIKFIKSHMKLKS